MGKVREAYNKVALRYLVPVELGILTLLGVHFLADYDHHIHEANINKCVPNLGSIAVKKAAIPAECTSFANEFPSTTTNVQSATSKIATTSYTFPTKHDFTAHEQASESDRVRLDALITVLGALGVTAGSISIAEAIAQINKNNLSASQETLAIASA